ncbi:hypothetical protein PoB_000346200 [Plakobranchus ocellatus]|uniref:Uncharacterized protein n=1 Tax=Plakobranchus ocellatus TaxID=259542 RepID=A0AAV3Y4G3_9GAST|nr:hypothetical protein PoB_000346200 [Plakobranchus ocellatus]
MEVDSVYSVMVGKLMNDSPVVFLTAFRGGSLSQIRFKTRATESSSTVEKPTTSNQFDQLRHKVEGRHRQIGMSMLVGLVFYIASPQQGDLRFSGHPSRQGAGDGFRTRNRSVPADLRADSLAIVPPTPFF